ncbi:hypothetical protein PHYC_02883 [Phycisphaerales bacterium]|nr:hypothetical protein PHYC_02883 [Phycisphaerales bacterium]
MGMTPDVRGWVLRWLACATRVMGAILVSGMLLASASAQEAPTLQADPGSVPKDRQANNIAIITIYGEIDGDGVMATSVERRIKMAERAGANAIVFEINSPGGALDGVLRICNAIKRSSITNTVAWINPDAYSGGAVIALACKRILINDPSTFGDAMPITMGGPVIPFYPQNIPPELLKKVLPPLLAEVVDSVRRHNRHFGAYLWDEYLVESIVANDVELWYVRNRESGTSVCIDRTEFEMLFPGADTGGPTRLRGVPGAGRPPRDVKAPTDIPFPAGSGKLGSVASDVESRHTISTQRPKFTAADVGKWELLDKVSDGTGPATFKTSDMVFFGFAANDMPLENGVPTLRPIRGDADLVTYFQGKHVIRYDRSWSEGLVVFLTNWLVRGVLIVVFLIALFVEMTHPGAIVPGAIALCALVGLIAPPMLIGMSGWWTVAAIVMGVVLLMLEVFVFPGFGVAGVLGLLLLFAGLVGTFLPRGEGMFPGVGEGGRTALFGATTVLLGMVTACIGIYFIAKHFKSLPVLGRLVLRDPGTTEESEGFLAEAMGVESGGVKVGTIGVAMTPMRPAGRVEVGDRMIDAVAEFGFIDAGTRVKVVRSDGFSIGVEEVRG